MRRRVEAIRRGAATPSGDAGAPEGGRWGAGATRAGNPSGPGGGSAPSPARGRDSAQAAEAAREPGREPGARGNAPGHAPGPAPESAPAPSRPAEEAPLRAGSAAPDPSPPGPEEREPETASSNPDEIAAAIEELAEELSDTALRRLSASELHDELAKVDILNEPIDTDDRPEAVMTKLKATSMSPRHQVEAWLAAMVQAGASDLILRAGGRPSTRVDGRIGFLPGRVPAAGALLEVLQGVIGEERLEEWRREGSVDAALDLDGLGRFRLNAYRQMGDPAIVLRRISENPPDLANLELPTRDLQEMAKRKRGLFLVTGIAGSGKSTTLSALIEFMNRTMERHVITLEDPVECLFKEKRCVISQREVGTDCNNFHEGLRHALRQSPDVILIGEMRDEHTVTAALDAAETGHLVMSTLHTVNAPQTLDRILGFYKAERHAQLRMRLAENLAGVLSQRLLPRKGRSGLVPACELLVSTPHIRELLEEGKTTEIGRVIEAVSEKGLISFNQSLKRLVDESLVELKDALAASDRPEELILALRGITKGTDRSAKPRAGSSSPKAQDGGGEGLRVAGR